MTEPLYRLRAHELRDLIRTRQTTALAVTSAYLERIRHVDPKVRSYLEVWEDQALARAEDLDAVIMSGEDPGPLAGVPIALKDVLCTTHGTTTCGSRILKGFRSPFNATAVQRLQDSGAVFLGKLNMDEFAMGSSTENSSSHVTRNPWDLERVPGGSSGGSAAAISADQAALTLGSDTGGSIRQPAGLCGCIGMKPTYGRVSRFGLVAFASSLDQIGPFAKDVEDLSLMLNVICGHDHRDSTSADVPVPDFSQALRKDIHDLRIGLPQEYYTEALGGDVRKSIETAIDVLKGLGAKVVEVSLPHTNYAVAAYYIICTAEASANLARFDGVRYGFRHPDAKSMQEMYTLTKTEGYGPEVQRRIILGTYVLSSGYYDAYYLKAQKVRALIRDDFKNSFQTCDVIVTPTSPTPAFKIGEKSDDPLEMYLSDIYTISANLAGLPGLSIPCGLTPGNLPVGLQLMGKPFDEETLVRVADAYERNRGFAVGPPPLN